MLGVLESYGLISLSAPREVLAKSQVTDAWARFRKFLDSLVHRVQDLQMHMFPGQETRRFLFLDDDMGRE